MFDRTFERREYQDARGYPAKVQWRGRFVGLQGKGMDCHCRLIDVYGTRG